MRKFLPYALGLTIATAANADKPETQFSFSADHQAAISRVAAPSAKENAKSFLKTRFSESFNNNKKKATGTRTGEVTVNPTIISTDGDGLDLVAAVAEVDGKYVLYGAQADWDTGEIEFSIPEGTYDMFAFGYTEDLTGTIIVVKPQVEIKEGVQLTFETAEATNRTDFKYISPSGEELSIPNYYGEGGNCSVGDAMNMLMYKGSFIFFGDVTLFSDAQNYVKSNFTDGDFSYYRLQFMAAPDGMLNMVIPVDFSKTEAGSTADGWQSGECTFAPTPVNINYDKLFEEMGGTDAERYSMSMFSIYEGNEWFGTAGLGVDGNISRLTNKVGFWVPEDEEVPFSFLGYPMGDVFGGDSSAIYALPFRRGEKEAQQVSINYAFDNNLVFPSDAPVLTSEFPYYCDAESDYALGNCTPLLVNYDNYIPEFSFVGRQGEVLTIDSWDMSENIDEPEAIEMFGGQTNSVVVKVDGKEISNQRENYPYDINWNKNGVYEVEFTTHNVLINGEVKGYTSGTLTYDSKNYDNTLPTATAFQVVNGDGKVTDFLATPENAYIRLFAATLIGLFNGEYGYSYALVNEPTDVKIEYAASGSGEYKELEVNKGELFIDPGFGQEYNIPLSSISDANAEGWVDIRISIEAENGSTQVQEICPALNIASLAGVDQVSSNNTSSKEYYSLQGVRLSSPVSGSIVIERNGSDVKKIIVK